MLDHPRTARLHTLSLMVVALSVVATGGARPAMAFSLYDALDLDRLAAHGLHWESATRDGVQWTMRGVTGPGIRVQTARITLGAPPRIALSGVAVNLARLRRGNDASPKVSAESTGEASESWLDGLALPDWLIDVDVQGLSIAWGTRRLVTDLSLRIAERQVSIEGLTLSGTADFDSSQRLRGVGRMDLGWVRGRVEVDLQRGVSWPLEVRLRQVRLDGKHVGNQPVHLHGIDLRLGRGAKGWHGEAVAGAARATVAVECPGAGACAVVMRVPETPLSALLAQVPELVALPREPDVTGYLSADARYRLSRGPLDLDVRLEGVRVSGTGVDVEAYQRGPFKILGWDADGEPRTFTSGDGSANWVDLYDVSPALVAALKAAEDGRFEHHPGYDVRAITEVVEEVVNDGRRWRGASTLTQQLVKNLFLNPLDRSVQRKVQELLIAAEVDRRLGKSRVLELYLNVVEWGPGIYGLTAACEHYFAKHPYDLTPTEAAWLVTALPSPKRFHAAWVQGRDRGAGRVNSILGRMYRTGALSEEEIDDALLEPLPRRCELLAERCY